MSEHKGIGWMYDGVKADTHREDYLLGKTIDKNFEKYSDAVITQKEEAVDALVKTRVVGTTPSITSKISSLPLNVMKSEDPLVAIRVKEESKRRDVLENPLTKLRFQKMLKEMMDKKSKKEAKKEKKRKRDHHSSHDDHSSSDEKRKKKKKEKKHKKEKDVFDEDRGRKEKKIKRQDSSSDEDHKRKDSHGDDRRSDRRSDERREERGSKREDSRRTVDRREKSRERSEERRRKDSSDEEMRKRKRRDSSGDGRRRESNGDEKRKRRDSSGDGRRMRRESNGDSRRIRRDSSGDDRKVKKEERRRRDSSEEDKSKKRVEKKEDKEKKRDFASHIPDHLKPGSSSESEEEKEDFDKEEKAAKAKWEGYGLVGGKKKKKSDEKDVKNPYELKRIPKFTVHEKNERKRPLTDEEKAAKLKEMESNVKWRADLRVSNERRARLEDEKEENDDDGRPASFVKPILNSVADGSMEDRLKQRKKQLQRGHGYMDKL